MAEWKGTLSAAQREHQWAAQWEHLWAADSAFLLATRSAVNWDTH